MSLGPVVFGAALRGPSVTVPVRCRIPVVVTAVAAVFAALFATPAPAGADTLGGRSALEIHAEQHVLAGHQRARLEPATVGLSGARIPELVWSGELARLARASSDRMASRGSMGHDPRIGDTLGGTRHGDNVGFRAAGATTSAAAARADANALVRAWLASPGHRDNLRNAAFTHVGVGVTIDANGGTWATVVFQARGVQTASTGPRAIDIDARCPSTGTLSRLFRDVDGVHTQAIDCLSAAGIVTGTTSTTYDPDRSLTRAQTAMLLERTILASDRSLPAPLRGAFTDVGSTSTSGPAIERLAAAGIVTGSSDGRFGPDTAITRGELARMLETTVIYLDGDPIEARSGLFVDVPADARHANAIDAAGEAGLIAGDTTGRFRAGDALQRDQAASVLARFLVWRG